MTKEELTNSIRELVTRCTQPNYRNFAFQEREDEELLTFEAVYPGHRLLHIDYEGLGAHLAAVPKIASTPLDETDSRGIRVQGLRDTGAFYRGFFDGVPVNLFLRCAGSGELTA